MGVLIDDKLHHNARVLAMSHEAFRLWMVSITWLRAEREIGDYVIPAAIARGLAAAHGVRPRTIAELVKQCRFHAVEGGYEVHDAADWDFRDPRVSGREGGKLSGKTRRSTADPSRKKQEEGSQTLRAKNTQKSREAGPQPEPVNTRSVAKAPERVFRAPVADDAFATAWLEAGRQAGHSDFALASGLGHVAADAAEAILAGEPPDRVLLAVQRLGREGRHRSLEIALRQVVAEQQVQRGVVDRAAIELPDAADAMAEALADG